MRKIWIWIKASVFVPYFVWLAHKVKGKTFEERFEGARIVSKTVLRLARAKVKYEGIEHVEQDQNYLFVGNHQGSLDPFIIIAGMPTPVSAVAKQELFNIPLIRTWFALLHGIGFNRESLKDGMRMIKELAATLKEGRSMVIFPEGTRSNSNETLEFKAGALKAAYMAKKSICPFVLVNAHTLVDTGKKAQVTMRFLTPITYETYHTMNSAELSNQLQASIQTEIHSILKEN
ncbi:MAG: lysophospholipid acyltransferase family protein [Erysipelotrichaceae bacterium]